MHKDRNFLNFTGYSLRLYLGPRSSTFLKENWKSGLDPHRGINQKKIPLYELSQSFVTSYIYIFLG